MIGEKLREYRGPRVTVHDAYGRSEVVVSLYELANAKWNKRSEEGGLSEIAADVKDVDGRDIRFAFVDEEESEYVSVEVKPGDWIVGKAVDIDYPDYDDIHYAYDLRKLLDLEFDYSGRKSEHYRKERAHVLVSHILGDSGWMPSFSLSANQKKIFDNAERKVYDYFVANDTEEISDDLYNEIYYGFLSKKFDESVSRKGQILKESGESRRSEMKRDYRCTISFEAYDDFFIDIAGCDSLRKAKEICMDMNAALARTDKEEGQFFVYDSESGSHRNRNGRWERETREGEWEVE